MFLIRSHVQVLSGNYYLQAIDLVLSLLGGPGHKTRLLSRKALTQLTPK